MRTEQPQMIYLKDYQAPEYLIDETHLTFELFDDHSLVHAQLVMRRNPARGGGLPPLVLDGQQLELLGVRLDDIELTDADYQLTPDHLTLHPKTVRFVIDSTVRIHPETNTALEGLYKSSGMFCTQCEAEGFRKITYYLDRPDVMSKFTTTVSADKHDFPVLLSNGNPIASGPGDEGRHWATWQDPFMKPAYLFALVAGDLWCVEDTFTTMSQRNVTLRIYVEPENIDKCQHAMDSLKKSMRWDEQTYGREYDLDIFMIVAVNDFNMGAMENKGLNIFNSSAVLARAATDAAHQRVEAIVAHEYFHNWSGNRVTCRDWFQLSLKEGFTVFRDAGFSADMNSATVKRIQDVAYLRTHQFAEDAGPMAHAVRPDSFIEISNFYTLTVYEKGSEVVGMIRTLLGAEGFRKGSDLYFQRHDGQAVTCDDFIKAMEDANGVDLTQFKRWYSQAGTPRLAVSEAYDAAAQTYSLTFRQSYPATPGQPAESKKPFVVPVELGLLDPQGQEIPLRLLGEAAASSTSRVLSVTEAEQTFTFIDIPAKPLPSLLRGFSAPVKLSFPYDRDQLMFLMQHDSDGFNRWDAGQQLSVQVLQELIGQYQQGQPLQMDHRLVTALATVLGDHSLDQAMVAEMLSLPGEAYLTEISEVADVDAIHAAREFARKQLAETLFEALWTRYQANREVSRKTPYVAEAEHFARRALQNIALSYLMLTEKAEVLKACIDQFDSAENMTERLTALAVLVNSPFAEEKAKALGVFAEDFKTNALVMDQWFSVQAGSPLPGGLERVKALMQHPAFTLKNPNKVRALIGAFAGQNLINFHAADGSGYRFLADLVIELNGFNPQIASRQLAPLTRWRKYDSARQALMKAELERIRNSGNLSSDVFEVVSKSLA